MTNDILTNEQRTKIAMRTSWISLAANAVLSVFKFLAGFFGRSAAMISDAVHSASDVFSTVVVMIGVKISGKEEDDDHPYGHEKLESIAAMLLATVLAVTGLAIGKSAVETVIEGDFQKLAVPTLLPLIAAVISIIVKEGMFWYTRSAAKKTSSDALMADAWHHRSDSLSSIGSLIGILGARMGLPILDPLAGLIICVFILKAAWDILNDALNKVVDKALDPKTVELMKEAILEDFNIIALDQIKTRQFGSKCYVDIEIRADGSITLTEAHKIAENVHHKIESRFPNVKHCMVHVNPENVK